VSAYVTVPHRGELCYVLREHLPSDVNSRAISFS
jgi:hypothetical protein